MSKTDGIDRFEKIVWKSNLQRKIEHFRETINEESNFENYFGIEYLEKLCIKSDKLGSKIIKFRVLIC